MKLSRFMLAISAPLLLAGIAKADLVPGGVVDVSGAGFGDVNTILTFQGTGQAMGGTESGCVGVNSAGVLNSIGSSVCQGGNLGGNEKAPAGFPHNQTFTVSNASQIGIVFNAAQPGGGSISLNNLTLALFNSSGAVGFTSGAFSAMTLNTTQPGIGNAGFLFTLSPAQAALAQTAINGRFDLLGLSATTSASAGGPETFFLTNVSPSTGTGVPESSTLSCVGIGVLGLALMTAMRRSNA